MFLEAFRIDRALGTNLTANRNPGPVYGFRITGNQRVPVRQPPTFGDPAIGATFRQRRQQTGQQGSQGQTIGHFLTALRISGTTATLLIKQTAGNVSEIDTAVVFVLKLDQAAAPTTVAQGFPFSIIEFIERFTLPERLHVIDH